MFALFLISFFILLVLSVVALILTSIYNAVVSYIFKKEDWIIQSVWVYVGVVVLLGVLLYRAMYSGDVLIN